MFSKRILIALCSLICLFSALPLYAMPANTQEFHLKNGLTLIVREDHRAPVVVSQIWYRVGGSDEPAGITGISHALEHMMFEGSAHYPDQNFNSAITQLGGQFNAATGADFTHYYELAPANRLGDLFKLEADRMANLTLSPQIYAKEIEVVKEERRMRVENNPQAQTIERFNNVALPGNPYHHPTVGWMRDLNQMTIGDVRNWYQRWYVPNNATVIVVGDVNPQNVEALANQYFGSIPARALTQSKTLSDIPSLAERALTLKLPAQLPSLLMGYNVPSLKTANDPKEAYALTVASAILSGGDSSRFVKDLIQGSGIATAAGTDYNLLHRFSTLFVMYGVPAQGHNLAQLQQAFAQEITRLQTQPISAQELARVKTAVEADKIYSQDSIVTQATNLGEIVSLGLPWQTEENFVKNIDAVTPEQVQHVAQKYFIPSRLTIAKLLPLPSKNAPMPTGAASIDGGVR